MQATSGADDRALAPARSRRDSRLLAAAVHRALEEAQRVVGGHHDRDRGDQREGDLGLEDADQDVELADEVGRAGHRQQRQGDDQEQRREHRRPEASPPIRVMSLGPGALVEQRDDQKQRRDDQPVGDHLQHRAVGAVGPQRPDPQRDEAELRDRGVAGDEPRVGLRERHHRPVEDRGERDQQDHLLEAARRGGEERQHDAQEAVGADLREHPGEDAPAPAAARPGRRRASSRAAGRPAS